MPKNSSDFPEQIMDVDSNKFLIIGDLHFREETMEDNHRVYEQILDIARSNFLSAIIILGDTLHTNETAKQAPFDLASDLIINLSREAKTYVLIGNHDYINNSQFLTDKHFFNPLKYIDNITIVDTLIDETIGNNDQQFVFCPYVPPERFHEALETVNWKNATAIFAHTEVPNCMRDNDTLVGDDEGSAWSEDYPPLISGHIHKSQKIGNVWFPGSVQQVTRSDTTEKCVYIVDFNAVSDDPDELLAIQKIKVDVKTYKKIFVDISNLNLDTLKEEANNHKVVTSIYCSQEEWAKFMKGPEYTTLKKAKVMMFPIFNDVPIDASIAVEQEEESEQSQTTERKKYKFRNFKEIFSDVVSKKSAIVQEVYGKTYKSE
mgnify:CR=1 FL=1